MKIINAILILAIMLLWGCANDGTVPVNYGNSSSPSVREQSTTFSPADTLAGQVQYCLNAYYDFYSGVIAGLASNGWTIDKDECKNLVYKKSSNTVDIKLQGDACEIQFDIQGHPTIADTSYAINLCN